MNQFRYRIFYTFDGPTKDDPFPEEKSEFEIDVALSQVPMELGYLLSDENAVVSGKPQTTHPQSVIIAVATELDETSVDNAMANCLRGLDLRGEKG